MKILFLSPTLPYPLTDGGRIRVFNLLKQIAIENDVTLLALETQDSDKDSITNIQDLDVKVHLVENDTSPPTISINTIISSLINKKPITVTRYDISAYKQKFKELLNTQSYDVVHYEMLHTAQFHVETDLPSVLSLQNVDSAIWGRLQQETINPFYKLAYWTQFRAFKQYEATLCPLFNVVTCTSDIDAAEFHQYCSDNRVVVIPNGVDVTHFSPETTSQALAHLIYIGSMDWFPNEDAVTFFSKEVLPIIQKSVPDVRFTIVGGNPSERILQLAKEEAIEVTGRVPEIKPYFAKATIFVVPLRIGSGTRLKILEALAMGKAVVSTTVGAEGLSLQNREEIIIADEPVNFAEEVVRLLTIPSLRNEIGKNGRKKVEQEYDWRNIAEKLIGIYESVISDN
ncbi:glycosyltransferase [Candidatus Poribacteria bacterium]|nr:glycosyltransferase [Candidatus Poribacteria bacterium]